MKCTCWQWKDNIDKVNGPMMLQAARTGNPNQYTGVVFQYCPWCGSHLIDDDHQEKPILENHMIKHEITIKGVKFTMEECEELYEELKKMFPGNNNGWNYPLPQFTKTPDVDPNFWNITSTQDSIPL